jgi:hypothetical protein
MISPLSVHLHRQHSRGSCERAHGGFRRDGMHKRAAAGHSMAALPNELLLRMLEHALVGRAAEVARRSTEGESSVARCTRRRALNGVTNDAVPGAVSPAASTHPLEPVGGRRHGARWFHRKRLH